MSLGVDRVCVVIGRTRHKMVAVEMQEAVKRGAKFVELRLDFLARAVEFKRLLPYKKVPTIATIRRPSDGGRWPGTEQERKMLLRQAIVSGFEWVDLETDIADEIRRFGTVKRIVSYHNLAETPSDLEEIYARMCKQDADVIKVSVMAQSPGDNIRVLNLLKSAPKPTVAHCMGDLGFPSRLLALKYGSPFLYAAFNKERGVAPGLPSFDELRDAYPIPTINAASRVYGLIGDPVGHSLSPILHNRTYQQLKLDHLYVPIRVPRSQLAETIRAFEAIPVHGYSVTIPHKEGAAGLAQTCDPATEQTSAANTLVRNEDGSFAALNTDYHAGLEAIQEAIRQKPEGNIPALGTMTALLLGAGGVARALAHALHREGTRLIISSRTLERAAKLAEEVGGKAVDWVARHQQKCDLLVNCTPVGMFPNVDESPIHASMLAPGMVVLDTIYNPETTLLVKEARLRGCLIATGVEMFIRQAAAQIRAFTGQSPALDAMRALVRRALSPLSHRAETADSDADEEGDDE